MQTTLKSTITFNGTGLHSGQKAVMRLYPAPADHGIVFHRTDVTERDNQIPALYSAVNDTQLCTRIRNDAGVELSTIEHVMAAFAGTGLHNVRVEVDGPEVPIMDGSAVGFVREILKTGLETLNVPVRAIRVLKEVSIAFDDVKVTLSPADNLEIDFSIAFADSAIGAQQKSLNMANGAFVRELSDSRTFCRRGDVEMLQANGLALGGSLENAIVVDQDKILNPEGFRHVDECVRHKMLDALGDLYLAGAPILGRYVGTRAGHRATNELLHALFAQKDAWEWITCDDAQSHVLPGSDIKPSDFRI